ncbi:helitron_like_N domain-containing protein [Trichonephila clavipes]|uniref:Helitron_like_N domain-containing protein n=1 Tax=Trichonephila clavipes TaxID=2585209 RepID=A0A8X6T4W1_TRICX|nr:helitron_like_N domain-containing protein [Trichonephila clavipes]
MLEDRNFMDECIDKNFVFLKSIPNSIQYWMTRKKDLFAMLRQLGKPTVFFTISANEIKWPKLLKILHGLSDSFKDIHVEDPLVNLNRSQRSHLVNEDPVTCFVYFNKLVDTIMAMLQAKMTYNPFGPYRVLDYFLRIEFQHRGSPRAHVLLWLENDPHEKISENMPKTIQLLTDLCSVSRNDLPGELYANQVYKHTFTCTKRGETSCRFGIPYWPMTETRVLLPLPKDDERKNGLQTRATKLRKLLEEKNYETLGEFLVDNNLTMAHYLDTIRATLRRPTVVFKRDLSEIYTNTPSTRGLRAPFALTVICNLYWKSTAAPLIL